MKRAILAAVATAAFALSCGADDCVHEGSVDYELVSLKQTSECQVELVAALRWAPCAEPAERAERVFSLDLATGQTSRLSSPSADATALATQPFGAVVRCPSHDTVAFLSRAAGGLINSAPLEIGEVLDLRSGNTLATVVLDSKRE